MYGLIEKGDHLKQRFTLSIFVVKINRYTIYSGGKVTQGIV